MGARSVFTAMGLALASVPSLPSVVSAQAVSEDTAIGSGTAGSGTVAEWRFDFRATSGPSGEAPAGEVAFEIGNIRVEGTVSCLRVTTNRAVIGVAVTFSSAGPFPGAFLTVTDGGGPGGEDTFDARPEWAGVPSDCSVTPLPLAEGIVDSGDITVVDAPPLPTSTAQCKNGGWRSFGVFKNQGDCISFVATRGKNPPG
jgi:hypothetical protein